MSDSVYCYPPEYTVLKNKAGLRDATALERFEGFHTQNRTVDCPLDLPITYGGYKLLHHYVFQDVYEWAGEIRTIPVEKGLSRFEFPERIDQEMQRVFGELNAEDNLRNLPSEKFAARAASYLDDLNITHPFREGNGRTQRLFLRNLADQAGHELQVSRILKDEWMRGSIESMHQSNHEPMIAVIYSAIAGRSWNHERDPDRGR